VDKDLSPTGGGKVGPFRGSYRALKSGKSSITFVLRGNHESKWWILGEMYRFPIRVGKEDGLLHTYKRVSTGYYLKEKR